MLNQKIVRKISFCCLATAVCCTEVFAQTWNSQLNCGRISDLAMFMVDYSGSMSVPVAVSEKEYTKIEFSLKLIEELVSSIPNQSELRVGLSSLAPQALLIKPNLSNFEEFKSSLSGLPTRMEIFGRQTNLGEGIADYSARIKKIGETSEDESTQFLLSKTTLVIITDGDQNNRGREVAEIWDQFKTDHKNIRPVIISFATTREEEATINSLSTLIGASVYQGLELLSSKKLQQDFVLRELYVPCPDFDFILSADTLFAFDKATLTDKGRLTIREVSEKIAHNIDYITSKQIKFSISAHTDKIGTDSYNLKLSERRLRTVLQELEKNGVDMTLFTSRRAEGERKPITKNACIGLRGDEVIRCLQPDRRVEIRMIQAK